MDTVIDKHYIGFEGEPEIQFIRLIVNDDRIILRIWVGYFDSIMSQVKLGTDGWTGLAKYYHLYKGWYVESPWQVPDIIAVVVEFEKIDISALEQGIQVVYNDICSFLKDAQLENTTVWISYD